MWSTESDGRDSSFILDGMPRRIGRQRNLRTSHLRKQSSVPARIFYQAQAFCSRLCWSVSASATANKSKTHLVRSEIEDNTKARGVEEEVENQNFTKSNLRLARVFDDVVKSEISLFSVTRTPKRQQQTIGRTKNCLRSKERRTKGAFKIQITF